MLGWNGNIHLHITLPFFYEYLTVLLICELVRGGIRAKRQESLSDKILLLWLFTELVIICNYRYR